MKFKRLINKISTIEHKINSREKLTEVDVNISHTPKQILTEMKKIGIETLPYSYSALERFIDSETMDTHYNKHYKGYVKKLNDALSSRVDGNIELEQLVKGISRYNKTIRDNAFRVFDGTDGSPNYLDPLFISLDLKTNYNYYVTNKIQKLLSTYLIDYLLDPSFNYQAKNIGTTPLKDLMGKGIGKTNNCVLGNVYP